MLHAPCFGLQWVEEKKNDNVVNISFEHGRCKHLSANGNLQSDSGYSYWILILNAFYSFHLIGFIVHVRHYVSFVISSFLFSLSSLLCNPKFDREPFDVHIGIEYWSKKCCASCILHTAYRSSFFELRKYLVIYSTLYFFYSHFDRHFIIVDRFRYWL